MAETPLLHAQATALLLPPGAVLGGTTAATVFGVSLGRSYQEITALPPATIRSRAGLVVRRTPLDDHERVVFRGLPVTSPLRTAYDVGCHQSLEDGVIVTDFLLNKRLIAPGQLGDYARATRGRGSRQAQQACTLSALGAESPMETRQRLVIVCGGLPEPVCQYVVTDDYGGFLARVDLAYPKQKVAIDYDGADHLDRRRFANDLWRQNLLIEHGWTLLRFTAQDIFGFPDRVVVHVAAALGVAPTYPVGSRLMNRKGTAFGS